MAKKKVKRTAVRHHSLHKQLHRPVHDVIGYSVLFMFSVITLFIVLTVTGK